MFLSWLRKQADGSLFHSRQLPQGRRRRSEFRPRAEELEERTTPSATYASTVLATSPNGYWRLGENTGATTAADASGNNNTGTYNSGVTLAQPGVIVDDPNTSAAFNGSANASVLLPTATVLGLNGSFTAFAWVNTTGLGGDRSIFGTAFNGGNMGLHLCIRGTSFYMGFYGNDTGGTKVLSTNTWYFVAFDYDATAMTQSIYVNGVLDASSGGHAAFAGTTAVSIGQQGGGSNFTGQIDEAAITPKALTAAQILNLYTIGLANDVRFSASAYSAREDVGNALITITRSGDLTHADSVVFSTGTGGTAVAGVDYTPVTNQTVNFAVGQATATVQVPIFNQPGVQPTRTVNLNLTSSGATAAVVFPTAAAVLSIIDVNSTTALSSSLNPATAGQSVTFTATITTTGPAAPTGNVTFYDNGVSLGTVAVSSGQAAFSTSSLAVGSHSITAVYNGDANYGGSTSPALIETIAQGAPAPVLITGADAGGVGQVNVYNSNGTLKAFLLPFGTAFTGGVRVATGDVNGDGTLDYIAAAGPGGGPQVSVYDGKTNQLLYTFFAIGTSGAGSLPAGATAGPGIGGSTSVFGFAGGLYVAAGDVYGNGYDDIIVGAGAGGGPQVLVFDGKSGALVSSFYAFSPGFRGGVHVAAGDVNGDGKAEIIVGAGAGGGPQVTVYDGFGHLLNSFFAFVPSFSGGVWVSAGDLNGDGKAEIITGAGAGGGPQVEVFDGSTLNVLSSFYAMSPSFTGGVRVAVTDAHKKANIVVAAGKGGGPQVETFDGSTLALLGSFFAYSPTFTGGVMV